MRFIRFDAILAAIRSGARASLQLGAPTIALFVMFALSTALPALADPNPFAGASTTGRNFVGFAVNAFLIIVLSLGAIATLLGFLGRWKDPRHNDMWGHTIEAGLSAIGICSVALAFFNGGPALITAIQSANANP